MQFLPPSSTGPIITEDHKFTEGQGGCLTTIHITHQLPITLLDGHPAKEPPLPFPPHGHPPQTPRETDIQVSPSPHNIQTLKFSLALDFR